MGSFGATLKVCEGQKERQICLLLGRVLHEIKGSIAGYFEGILGPLEDGLLHEIDGLLRGHIEGIRVK